MIYPQKQLQLLGFYAHKAMKKIHRDPNEFVYIVFIIKFAKIQMPTNLWQPFKIKAFFSLHIFSYD